MLFYFRDYATIKKKKSFLLCVYLHQAAETPSDCPSASGCTWVGVDEILWDCKNRAFNYLEQICVSRGNAESRNRNAEGRLGNASEPPKWGTGGFNNPHKFGCNLLLQTQRGGSHPRGVGIQLLSSSVGTVLHGFSNTNPSIIHNMENLRLILLSFRLDPSCLVCRTAIALEKHCLHFLRYCDNEKQHHQPPLSQKNINCIFHAASLGWQLTQTCFTSAKQGSSLQWGTHFPP